VRQELQLILGWGAKQMKLLELKTHASTF
jgi:hypothetical protein